MTARFTIERLRRMASMTAPCYGCRRQRVRADLERCAKCGMLTCDRCVKRCFCGDSQRVAEAASDDTLLTAFDCRKQDCNRRARVPQ